MAIEVVVDRKQINGIVKRLSQLKRKITGPRIMNVILLKVKGNILLRTNAGKDVNFKNFKPYNPTYAAREGKSLVNLTLSGLTLNSMTQKVLSNTSGVIFFSNADARERAKWHNTGDGNPKREFFGVNTKDDKLALKTYEKEVKKVRKQVGI